MRLLPPFRSRRSADRPGSAPAVEAALRARRAREHLARKRRSDRRHERGTDRVPEERPVRPRTSAPTRTSLPARPLPRGVVPAVALTALLAGFVAAPPLFERLWLPRVPLERVTVVGTAVRQPETIARRLLARAGMPLSNVRPDQVSSLVTADPWIESAESFRLPEGTLLVRVVERRAVARHQDTPDGEVTLVDPAGLLFPGAVTAGGPLPLVTGPVEPDAPLSPTTLEILTELARHEGLARDPSALTLHLPVPAASASDADRSAERDADDRPIAAETGYVLEIGRAGTRVLLGESFLKRRIARLAALLEQRDALLAGANVIDLRYADRAVLRTEHSEPTSG